MRRYNLADVEISYILTRDDYVEGFRAFRARTAYSRWVNRISRVCFVLLLALALFLSFIGHDKSFHNLFPLWALLALWVYILWGCPYYVAHKMMKGRPSAPLVHTLDISESGLSSRTSVSESRLTWDVFVGWEEVEGVFSLFPSPISYYPVPKRAMTSDQMDEFRALLRAKLSPRKNK